MTAWLADGCVQACVLLVVAAFMSVFLLVPGFQGFGIGVMLVVMFGLQWFYGAFFETIWNGQTPGKALMSLRVVRDDGSPGRLPDFVLRNLLRSVDFLPVFFGVGVVSMAVDERFRRLGDLAAGTVVISEQRTRVLGDVLVEPPVTDEEREALPAGVRLSRGELRTIEDFLRRRHRFSEARAEELASYLGPVISERTGVKAESNSRVLTLAYARATGKDR